MNRNELAKELKVPPWDIDSWLLRGCPARKVRSTWEFDLDKIRIWLESEKVKIKRTSPQHLSSRAEFDKRWFRGRCPICIERGFAGDQAGRVYTLGEVSEGEWHLRRTGIPCGHSAYLKPEQILNLLLPRIRSRKAREMGGLNSRNDFMKFKRAGSKVTGNRKKILEVLAATPEVRKDKIAALKKAISNGTYHVRTGDTAAQIIKELVLELVLIPGDRQCGEF
jgi:anti-sigma28 factor (negative regulator of flagellin synthesis)